MLSSLLRPKRTRRGLSPFLSPYAAEESSPLLNRGTSLTTAESQASELTDDDGENDLPNNYVANGEDDEDNGVAPLLPIFSAAHLGMRRIRSHNAVTLLYANLDSLDSLPVYHLTHVIRLLIVSRCDTTLTWDQLRSPQVSQFLVKPVQLQIRQSHLSSATIYALMANDLQFDKEGQLNPGNSGTSKTRSLVCELLAIKLLKEFSTRELIDALSYDFFPLQGLPEPSTASPPGRESSKARSQPRAVRISTLEIAIRAQAKRFLAHPLVVKHLEAIWAGTIVFHSAADNLHRSFPTPVEERQRRYGTNFIGLPILRITPDKLDPIKPRDRQQANQQLVRRAVSLYDPRNASLFKLSRLRVPRYRQTLSTASFSILLALYLAVLIERSLSITTLEVIFWFWSAGFMLDEVVGFNEQGFSLYIMSFWNIFDLGILLLLVCFYVLRIYGILMPEHGKGHIADLAYDVLAANAVLLFPRLFSVLDHYRYFSQLLIAFRLMAIDLVAVFILILIACSGFFVAFTLSFGKDGYDAPDVAYTLFQILLGFTPAAWNVWDDYNALGKTILTLFLFICHFLIVTILITVLTNSFMATVTNANEEHQFVFAVNAIAMVKSDALFSYIAPTNIIAWLLAPLRYVISFRTFVRINRTFIKVTHFPVLFAIYAYERVILCNRAFGPTDLVDDPAGHRSRVTSLKRAGRGLFSPKSRLRQESVVGYQKDQALDEVFRVPFTDATVRQAQKSQERQKTSKVVNSWMQGMGPDGRASPPAEQDRSIVEQLEARRLSMRRSHINPRRRQSGTRVLTNGTRSVASDPEDFMSATGNVEPGYRRRETGMLNMNMDNLVEQIEADGDDELASNDEEDIQATKRLRDLNRNSRQPKEAKAGEDYFQMAGKPAPGPSLLSSSLAAARRAEADRPTTLQSQPPSSPANVQSNPLERQSSPSNIRSSPPNHLRQSHRRTVSSTTILYNPIRDDGESSASPPKQSTPRRSPKHSSSNTPKPSGRRSPRRIIHAVSKPRPIMPPRSALQSAPNLAGLVMIDPLQLQDRASSFALDLASEVGLHDNADLLGAVPSSFATQMALATGAVHARPAHAPAGVAADDAHMMSRLMLARMKSLEEGFREVLAEVRQQRRADERSSADGDEKCKQHTTARRGKKPARMPREKTGRLSNERRRPSSAELKREGGMETEDLGGEMAEG